jgi:hypothetical protein
LIISRFEPGTVQAGKIVRKAEGKRNFIENIKTSEKKKRKKMEMKKGIDKIKQAESILNRSRDNNK